MTIEWIKTKSFTAIYRIYTLDNFVSDGTLGMQSLKNANAEFMLCVLRRSFLLAVDRRLPERTNGIVRSTQFVDKPLW